MVLAEGTLPAALLALRPLPAAELLVPGGTPRGAPGRAVANRSLDTARERPRVAAVAFMVEAGLAAAAVGLMAAADTARQAEETATRAVLSALG